MVCDCLISLFGYGVSAYAVYKLFQIFYAIVFPYFYAVPHNLQVLAGAKWAGKSLKIF